MPGGWELAGQGGRPNGRLRGSPAVCLQQPRSACLGCPSCLTPDCRDRGEVVRAHISFLRELGIHVRN